MVAEFLSSLVLFVSLCESCFRSEIGERSSFFPFIFWHSMYLSARSVIPYNKKGWREKKSEFIKLTNKKKKKKFKVSWYVGSPEIIHFLLGKWMPITIAMVLATEQYFREWHSALGFCLPLHFQRTFSPAVIYPCSCQLLRLTRPHSVVGEPGLSSHAYNLKGSTLFKKRET